MICCPVGQINNVVNSINRPNDRNQALFRIIFLSDALRTLTTQRRPEKITEIIAKGPRLILGENPLKALRLLFHQCRQ
jgi:hypothetical protein